MNVVEEKVLSDEVLARLIQCVYRYTGITLTVKKRSLLQGRLTRRLSELGLRSFTEYADYLSSPTVGGDEVQVFIDAVTTNLTSFFRTPQIWTHFLRRILPDWHQLGQNRPIRIWSAAAASGQEPYSIAMMCDDFARRTPAFSWNLLASDISTAMLATARAGRYPSSQMTQISRGAAFCNLQRYFQNEEGFLTVRPELKKRIEFRRHHLFERISDSPFDVVFLRNVLIYFSPEDRSRVLDRVFEAIVPGGTIIVGETETLLNRPQFKYVRPSIYTKLREAA